MRRDGIGNAVGAGCPTLIFVDKPIMFLGKERPLAMILQLSGIGLLAYDLFASTPQASGSAAVAGLAVFVIGTLLSRAHL